MASLRRGTFSSGPAGALSTYDELAANGFMLLGERLRAPEERATVLSVLENVMKVKVCCFSYKIQPALSPQSFENRRFQEHMPVYGSRS